MGDAELLLVDHLGGCAAKGWEEEDWVVAEAVMASRRLGDFALDRRQARERSAPARRIAERDGAGEACGPGAWRAGQLAVEARKFLGVRVPWVARALDPGTTVQRV